MQKPGLFGMNGVFIFMLSIIPVALSAQQQGSLILIDAENKQSFTVTIGDQLYASSGHGHLILSHLKDSSYHLNLRFPKKNISEQVFPVTVHQKDQGFQLRGSDSTWVLYNWQTKETIHPMREKDSSRILYLGVRREDGFSKLMAAVVNDTSVMYNTYKGNGFGKDTTRIALVRDTSRKTVSVVDTTKSVASIKEVPAKQVPDKEVPVKEVPEKPAIAATASKSNKKAVRDSLLVAQKRTSDSLTAVRKANADSVAASKITVSKTPVAATQPPVINGQPPAVNHQSTSFSSVKKIREISLKISRKMVFTDVSKDGVTDTITLFVYFEQDTMVNVQNRNKAVLPVKAAAIPACAQQAGDGDLEATRSAILKANSEPDKIGAATNAFSLKCYSVAQIRVLAGLLISDKAKYGLMEAAHLHLTDPDHFRQLADMYTDKNFQKKFLSLADKRS